MTSIWILEGAIAMEEKYFVKPSSWNVAGWFMVLYLNEAGAPTIFCETPVEDFANLIARLLNEYDAIHRADEKAVQRLAEFDLMILRLEGLCNKMRLEDAARILEAE
jgi:hypothetical protein